MEKSEKAKKTKNAMQQVLSQLAYDPDVEVEDARPLGVENFSTKDVEEAQRSTWVELYRKYRRPRAPSDWKWSPNSRPGRHCDSHLLDYFSCIDRTKDRLAPGEPPETYCMASQELTTACMTSTLCENKLFEVANECQEMGNPNDRSTECWSKIWIAQSCVQHTQFLLSKPFWASRPDTMSTTDRYMILLGAPTVPGKKGVSPGFLQRRKQFIKEALTPTKEQKEDEVPYIRP